MEYQNLKIGDTFSLFKNDKREFVKEKEGALQIKDSDGFRCESLNHKVYPYLSMTVYKRG